jgi:AhpD family alkylhydroperoxidase
VRSAGRPISEGSVQVRKGVERKHKCLLKQDLARAARDFGGSDLQLMAVAVALTTQCPYCIELHVKAARQAGANDTMLPEAAIVAAAMRAASLLVHSPKSSQITQEKR